MLGQKRIFSSNENESNLKLHLIGIHKVSKDQTIYPEEIKYRELDLVENNLSTLIKSYDDNNPFHNSKFKSFLFSNEDVDINDDNSIFSQSTEISDTQSLEYLDNTRNKIKNLNLNNEYYEEVSNYKKNSNKSYMDVTEAIPKSIIKSEYEKTNERALIIKNLSTPYNSPLKNTLNNKTKRINNSLCYKFLDNLKL
jgi:hypothetical protein